MGEENKFIKIVGDHHLDNLKDKELHSKRYILDKYKIKVVSDSIMKVLLDDSKNFKGFELKGKTLGISKLKTYKRSSRQLPRKSLRTMTCFFK